MCIEFRATNYWSGALECASSSAARSPLRGHLFQRGQVPSSKNRTRRHGLVRATHRLPLPTETETALLPGSKPVTSVALLAAAHGFMALGQQAERPA